MNRIITLLALRSHISISLSKSSVSTASISEIGSSLVTSSTWTTASSLKHRRTCSTTVTERMLLRNLFPRPAPLEAPRIRPAISQTCYVREKESYDLGWSGLLRLASSLQSQDIGVVNCYFRDIGLDCTEWVIRGFSCLSLRQSVKESGFSDIRIAHQACAGVADSCLLKDSSPPTEHYIKNS